MTIPARQRESEGANEVNQEKLTTKQVLELQAELGILSDYGNDHQPAKTGYSPNTSLSAVVTSPTVA